MNRLANAVTHPVRIAMTAWVVAFLGPGSVPDLRAAQTAEQRLAIQAYGDSLDGLSDSMALKREEAALLAAARYNRNDPFFHLRLAYVALRLGDLGGPSHYDDAASEFKTAAQLEPRWPYAWFGVGMAEFALGARAAGNWSILAQDAWSRAASAFARAAMLESGFAARLEELAREGFRLRLESRAEIVRDALQRATAGHAAPRLLLALGRVQRELNDSLALRTFETFLRVSDSSALGLMELGRTRLLHGRLDGLELYLRGAATDDPVAIQEFRSDLLPLATAAELADFDLRRGTSRAGMVRKFWQVRDRLELREDGERLGEHFRRLAAARKEFLVADPSGAERFDDRGRIYVRHGPPADRASLQLPGVEPNESWRYRRAGGDLLLHFAGRRSPSDFRLVESVLDVAAVRMREDGAGGGGGQGAGAPNGPERLIRSRAPLSPLYRDAAIGDESQLSRFLARERAIGRRGIQIAGGLDTYPKTFFRELDAWGSIVVGGAEQGVARAQLLFAIPADSVEPLTRGGGAAYPVRVRFVAVGEAGAVVARADTMLMVETPVRVASNGSVSGRFTLPLPPGRLLARASVEYGDSAGTVFALDTLHVPERAASELDLGDLLVGSRRGEIPLRFDDGLTISLAAGGVVHRSDRLDLVVEVFGLGSGAEAEMRVLLAAHDNPDVAEDAALKWRPFPQGRTSAKLTGPADGGPVRWRVVLPLSRLKQGEWVVAVEATDRTGRTVRRTSPIVVQLP